MVRAQELEDLLEEKLDVPDIPVMDGPAELEYRRERSPAAIRVHGAGQEGGKVGVFDSEVIGDAFESQSS